MTVYKCDRCGKVEEKRCGWLDIVPRDFGGGAMRTRELCGTECAAAVMSDLHADEQNRIARIARLAQTA